MLINKLIKFLMIKRDFLKTDNNIYKKITIKCILEKSCLACLVSN